MTRSLDDKFKFFTSTPFIAYTEVYDTKPHSHTMSQSSSPIANPTSLRRAEAKGELSSQEELAWNAFEKAKSRMCGQAAKQTIEVLNTLGQYADYKHASAHPFYVKIKGKGQIDDPECFYYPYLLVIQAIWPRSASVRAIAKAFSKFWGAPDMWRGPDWYPRLNDREREMELFMGEKQHVTEVQGEAEPTENVEDASNKENASIPERETTPEIDKIKEINNMEELDRLETLCENREEELMAQVQKMKEIIRTIQERKRDRYMKKSSMSKRISEELKKQLEEEIKISEYWARKESEYAKKLEQSSTTIPVASDLLYHETYDPKQSSFEQDDGSKVVGIFSPEFQNRVKKFIDDEESAPEKDQSLNAGNRHHEHNPHRPNNDDFIKNEYAADDQENAQGADDADLEDFDPSTIWVRDISICQEPVEVQPEERKDEQVGDHQLPTIGKIRMENKWAKARANLKTGNLDFPLDDTNDYNVENMSNETGDVLVGFPRPGHYGVDYSFDQDPTTDTKGIHQSINGVWEANLLSPPTTNMTKVVMVD
ncbi:hypothetical protein IL306_009704 [Fusarium sp. DS 682]|nr:hypothetical protein IL306_009704 [Fusarium sp. DS 682]